MIKGFKEFIVQGNVIDLAVAVVIGTAFTAVINAIVESIINPIVAIFYEPNEAGEFGPTITGLWGQQVTFPLGSLVSAIITFLAVAIVVYFVFVHPMNVWKERRAAKAGIPEPESAPTEQELLVQIRDLLERQTGVQVSTTPPAGEAPRP